MTTISFPGPPPATLHVSADVEPPDLKVILSGEIDFACSELLQAFAELDLAGVTRVVVDLSGLEFTDIAGLRALMRFRTDQLDARRDVRLIDARPAVRRVFTLCGEEALLAA